MSDKTGISWTDATWNPVRGCSRVSEGCRNCYAETMAGRFSGEGQPYEGLVKLVGPVTATRDREEARRVRGTRAVPRWNGKTRFVREHLGDPLKWAKPRRIFVNSMSDLFHESLDFEHIAAIYGVMAAAPRHTFQVLTKRPARAAEFFAWLVKRGHEDRLGGDTMGESIHAELRFCAGHELGDGSNGDREEQTYRLRKLAGRQDGVWPLPNVWLGVSVEDQAAAEERVPLLLKLPAAVRFLSCEPLLGPVDLDRPRCRYPHHDHRDGWVGEDPPWCNECDEERSFGHWLRVDGGIDWVIAECESGPRARPCYVAWLRELRNQCAEAEVPFFLKQAVEPVPVDQPAALFAGIRHFPPTEAGVDGSRRKLGGVIELPYLDGVQHVAFPEVAP